MPIYPIMRRYGELIKTCDTTIRHGDPREAHRLLGKLSPSHIPREWRVELAKLCRRAGMTALGLRMLWPVLRKPHSDATPSERAEYAILLLRNGAIIEALGRLEAIDERQAPEAQLYRAFGHFARWEFAAAIPLLDAYLKEPLSPYARLVALTNLASAYVECARNDQALALLDENIKEAKSEGHLQLLYNNLAFRGQMYMQAGEYGLARAQFKLARTASETSGNDQFLVTRLALLLDGLEQKSEAPFAELRRLALERRNWGALRDADFFSLKVHFEKTRFLHLYFGTPYADFREKIAHELQQVPDRKIYVLGPKNSPRLDLANGQVDGVSLLRAGGKCHQILEILLRDFYQPCRVATFFNELMPGEQYNIDSSPGRVHQLLWRTREWFEENRLPLAIREDNGFYSLINEGSFSFRVPLTRERMDAMNIKFLHVEKLFQAGVLFSNQDVHKKLKISLSSAQRLLNWAIETRRLERLGDSKQSTLYRFPQNKAA